VFLHSYRPHQKIIISRPSVAAWKEQRACQPVAREEGGGEEPEDGAGAMGTAAIAGAGLFNHGG
jgi:hypothetical protein